MNRKMFVCLAFGVLLLFPLACNKDCVTCGTEIVSGSWILKGTLDNDTLQPLPDDTLTYYSNHTGIYRTQFGWGWFDFTYDIANDSIFMTKTDGQGAGSSESFRYEINADTLLLVSDGAGTDIFTVFVRK